MSMLTSFLCGTLESNHSCKGGHHSNHSHTQSLEPPISCLATSSLNCKWFRRDFDDSKCEESPSTTNALQIATKAIVSTNVLHVYIEWHNMYTYIIQEKVSNTCLCWCTRCAVKCQEWRSFWPFYCALCSSMVRKVAPYPAVWPTMMLLWSSCILYCICVVYRVLKLSK